MNGIQQWKIKITHFELLGWSDLFIYFIPHVTHTQTHVLLTLTHTHMLSHTYTWARMCIHSQRDTRQSVGSYIWTQASTHGR